VTLVVGTVKDVSGVPDNAEWRFSSVLRENFANTGVVSTKTVIVKPVAGAFSVAVDPGFVIVNYKGKNYQVTVPNQTSIDVWDLISITVPLPSSAVTAFGNGLATATSALDARTKLLAEFTGNKGIASGYASLDSGGKIPIGQLPNSIMEYQGTWNASTNTPTLANGTGSAGDVYRVSVAGTQFSVSFSAGDYVIYSGSVWERSSSSSFTSTGPVTGSTLVSTVASGTAPLTVTSGTQVSNLNAQYVGGQYPTAGATASTIASRDSNINLTARGFISGFTSTVTSATPVTLTVASNSIQEFTGTLAQTVVLPTTGIVAGQQYTIINNSSGAVLVQSSSLATVATVYGGISATFTALVAAPTTPAHWERATVDATMVSGYGPAQTTAANTLAVRDASSNLQARGFVSGLTSTATSATTVTLIASSSQLQEFTGTIAQTVVLPSTGVLAGQSFKIINNSSMTVSVQSSTLSAILAITAGTEATFTALVATPTTAAHWEDGYYLSLTAVQTVTNKTLTSPVLTTPVINGQSTGTGVAATSTGSTLALRDGNAHLFAKSLIPTFVSTVASATAVTLTISSASLLEFTGTSTQTVVLPTTGVTAGHNYRIINNSTGALTVQSSALAAVGAALTTGTSAQFIALVATPTTAAHWHRK
jgi:hypothetical protein